MHDVNDLRLAGKGVYDYLFFFLAIRYYYWKHTYSKIKLRAFCAFCKSYAKLPSISGSFEYNHLLNDNDHTC